MLAIEEVSDEADDQIVGHELPAVDGLSNAFENLLDSTDALDGDVLPFADVIRGQRGRLGVIDVESGLDGLRVVV